MKNIYSYRNKVDGEILEEPPVQTYLLYAILISVVFVIAYIIYQHFIITGGDANRELSRYMRDFGVVNQTFSKGTYSIYLFPTTRVVLNEVSVNDVVMGDFAGVGIEKDSVFLVEGNAKGEIFIQIKYTSSSIEHTAYMTVRES